MKTLIVYLTSLLMAAPVFARIGETESEIEARYGKSIGTLSRTGELPQKAYASAGMNIVVTYIDGKSAAEIFSKIDHSVLSENEVEILMQANGGAHKWNVVAAPALKAWQLDNGELYALRNDQAHGLIICARSYYDTANATQTKAEKEKLKGF